MGNFIKTQNSFAAGEVAPEFFARDDIAGLSRLENMDVISGGGLRRRAGLVHVTDVDDGARLVPFSVGENENYMLVLSDTRMMVFDGDARIADMKTPWNTDALSRLQYAQRFGTMIFVHPDFPPQVLRKDESGFVLVQFQFARDDETLAVKMPFMKFEDAEDIKIIVAAHSKGNNYARFTTDSDFWTPEYKDVRLELLSRQWTVYEYVSPREVVAYTNGTYSLPAAAVSDWREAVFSNVRGWPCSITFHQDRLVFGGSRAWPAGVWMSQVGRHNNFDVGTGLDDQAIFITLLSRQRQQICTVVSSDNLQILTSAGEWAISNKPLTPSAVDIKQHTSVGSVASHYLCPQKIEGATVFISGTRRDIRELSLDELSQNYNANDLCALAKHLMREPTDLAYNDDVHRLYIVMADGSMAVLNKNAAVGISAWGRYTTDGRFQSVAVLHDQTFVVVRRGNRACLERFDDSALSDAGDCDFSFAAAAMPLRAGGHDAARARIRKITVRLVDTKSVFINGVRVLLPNEIYADGAAGYTGDASVALVGSMESTMSAPWVIHGGEQLPATILSVRVHGRYSV